MKKVIVIKPERKEEFDRFIAAHPKGHFLQSWEWGEVKRRMGWEPLPLALVDEGKIAAALLVLKRRLPLPGLNKSIFYAPRGPVADVHDYTLLDDLFEGARDIARKHGAIFLKLDPDIDDSDEVFARYLSSRGFRPSTTSEGFEGVQPTCVFRLDIRPGEEELLAAMAPKTRYNLRLAEKRGVVLRQAQSIDELKEFYRILTETAERDEFLIRDYHYFEYIWEHMVDNDMARVFLAEYQGQVIAGSLAMILGDKAWYLYGASSNKHRNVMPNYLVQWHMIKWARENGCTLYDFRGVSGDLSEDNPLYGLYRFKKGFGGDFTRFIGEWDKVYSSFYYLLWTRGMPLYSRSVRYAIRLKKRLGRS